MSLDEKQIEEYNKEIMRRIFNSILATCTILFFMSLISIVISQFIPISDNLLFISLFIIFIFIIFYCTFTILDKIEKIKGD